ITGVLGNQVRHVDGNRGYRSGLPLLCREIFPKVVEEWIRRTLGEQDRNYGEVAPGIGMHQVSYQIILLAIDVFLGGMVKVKLLQRVSDAVDAQGAPARI